MFNIAQFWVAYDSLMEAPNPVEVTREDVKNLFNELSLLKRPVNCDCGAPFVYVEATFFLHDSGKSGISRSPFARIVKTNLGFRTLHLFKLIRLT